MMIQLNPPIPVWVEGRGTGHAYGWCNFSQEHHLIWLIGFDETGEFWEIPNPKVRLQKNITMDRKFNINNNSPVFTVSTMNLSKD